MMKSISLINIFKGLVVSISLIAVFYFLYQLPILNPLRLKIIGKKTVAEQVALYEWKVAGNLQSLFNAQSVEYPPKSATLLFIKSKRVLELYVPNSYNEMKFIKAYRVLAASGKSGPKLQNGDYQVPEGVYSIESLNPNSAYHLSLRLNYPNEVDVKNAKEDGRFNLGSDIMIHGDKVSIGCIAIGNEAIEELFVLAAKSDFRSWKVISSPEEFRLYNRAPPPRVPKAWIPDLYKEIARQMSVLPLEGVGLSTSADVVTMKKGRVTKEEVKIWLNSKETEGYERVASEYFELSFPANKYVITGEGEESDPRRSASWSVERQIPDQAWIISNGFSIRYSGVKATSSLSGLTSENVLLRQPLRVNGFDAYMQVDAIDSNPGVGVTGYGEGGLQLRWIISIVCKGKLHSIYHLAQSGRVSLDLVEKGNYDFPEDFKQIISTFKCY